MLPQTLVDFLPLPLSAPASAGVRTLSTGVEALDAGLSDGGLPRGRLTEVVGARGSGKATLLRQIVEQTLSEAGWVAYIDATRTLAASDWAHLGDEEGLWMVRPRDPSRAAWCADVLLRCGAFALVIIDSAPVLSRGVAVRLTRLARESGAALVIAGEEGSGSLLGGAVRLHVEREAGGGGRRGRGLAPRRHPPPDRRMTIVVEKGGGGTHRTVEVSCAIGVARRLCTYPEVPDRRGVARRTAGGSGSERRPAALAVPSSGATGPNDSSGATRVLARKRRCAEPAFGVGDLQGDDLLASTDNGRTLG
ncbi:MAG TPA: hypothetical protein VGH98_16985 [Gemmatimonadaceae bacterium]|jgi:hypothetical protein